MPRYYARAYQTGIYAMRSLNRRLTGRTLFLRGSTTFNGTRRMSLVGIRAWAAYSFGLSIAAQPALDTYFLYRWGRTLATCARRSKVADILLVLNRPPLSDRFGSNPT